MTDEDERDDESNKYSFSTEHYYGSKKVTRYNLQVGGIFHCSICIGFIPGICGELTQDEAGKVEAWVWCLPDW